MLQRFRKLIERDDVADKRNPVSIWAETLGIAYKSQAESNTFSLSGITSGKHWKLGCGSPTRDFIKGQELLARAELDLPEDISLLVVNRSLKETLERRTYSLYTDSLQTTMDQTLSLEMRWLAMYPETGWAELLGPFSNRYAVVAEHRIHAAAWLNSALLDLLMSWPEPGPGAGSPFVLMIKDGKAYLRMQYSPADLPTLVHAAAIFTAACDSAVAELSTDIML
jgi:hypothetical protein